MCRGRGRPGRCAGMREREREGLSDGPGPDHTLSLGSREVAEQIWVGLGNATARGRWAGVEARGQAVKVQSGRGEGGAKHQVTY